MIEVISDTVCADFLVPATVLKMEKGESLWKQPSSDQHENHILYQNSGLPIYPVMTINHYSTHCAVIYQLLNYDLAEKFIQVFLCYNYLKIGYFDYNVFYDCSITILLIQQYTTLNICSNFHFYRFWYFLT